MADLERQAHNRLMAMENLKTVERLHSLVLEDDPALASAYERILITLGYNVTVTHTVADARNAIRNKAPDVILVDIDLPDGNGLDLMNELRNDTRGRFVVITGDASQRAVVKSIRHQAVELLHKPVDLKRLRACLATVHPSPDKDQGSSHPGADCWVYQGDNPSLVTLRTIMSHAAERSRGHALIIGEPGLDKPAIAQALHHRGRRSGACIFVDCSKAEAGSELVRFFGQENTDTGVVTHKGYLEQAAAGTLIINHVEKLPEKIQARFLPFLDSGRFKRVDGRVLTDVTVSVVGISGDRATADVDDSALRSDFLIRLKQHLLLVPSLRHCREDLVHIAEYLLRAALTSRADSPALSTASHQHLATKLWPGNIRQLSDVIKHALSVTAPEHLVELADPTSTEGTSNKVESSISPWVGTTVWEMERQLLVATLARFGGDKDLTAQTLGISLKTLYNRINSI